MQWGLNGGAEGETPCRDNFLENANYQTAPVLEKMYQLLLWLIPTAEKLPKSLKFLLDDRLQALALDAHVLLIEATYSRDKAVALTRVNLNLEKLCIVFRLAFELQFTDECK